MSELHAAEAAFLAGDSRRAYQIASDAAFAARQTGDEHAAIEAMRLQRLIRDLDRRIAMAGWGVR